MLMKEPVGHCTEVFFTSGFSITELTFAATDAFQSREAEKEIEWVKGSLITPGSKPGLVGVQKLTESYLPGKETQLR